MQQTNKCALVIADGKESRVLKARAPLAEGNSTFLQYVLDSVWTVVDELIVVFDKEPKLSLIEAIAPFGVKIAIHKDSSSDLSKIIAGLKASRSENCFVVPSSSPFVKPNVVFELFQDAKGFDAAIPKWKDGKIEPLLAVYSRKALLRASSSLKKKTIDALVDNLYAVSFVEIEKKLRLLDPELHSFFRVRTDRDMKKAEKIASIAAKQMLHN
jgi:molybdopterin-guanine dinucleotide biosynthesis protein A